MTTNDTLCGVCAEPWDAWGVANGDMTPWEARLFLRGVGCPSCEGHQPQGVDRRLALFNGASSLIGRGFDDWEQAAAVEAGTYGETGETWTRPAPEVLWTCAVCEVSLCVDPDFDRKTAPDLAYIWHGGKHIHYSYGGGYSYGLLMSHEDPCGDPVHGPVLVGGTPCCPGCATTCDHCCKDIYADSSRVDIYEEGGSVAIQEGMTVTEICGECLEVACLECVSPPGDCICDHEEEQ